MANKSATFELMKPTTTPFKHHMAVIQRNNPTPLHNMTKQQLVELDILLEQAQNKLKTNNITDFNIFIQDGKGVGELGYKHIWHIIGREEGDFENDNRIYKTINTVII